MSQVNTKKPSHYAYTVREGSDRKSHWSRIGAAWEIKDGFKIQIYCAPLDGVIILQVPKPKEEAPTEIDAE